MEIYFICTGNTCRSPMAEAILRAKQIPGLTVRSAGIYAADGSPISGHARTCIGDKPHTAQSHSVRQEHIETATHVLTMTTNHRDALIMMFPEAKNKIHTLKQFVQASDGLDISDPFGGSLDAYEQTYAELTQIIDKLVDQLNELS